MENIFQDDRSESCMRETTLAFKCLEKLYDDKTDKLTDKEMNALHDIAYLPFDNSYGGEIPSIGHLSKIGKQEVLKDFKEELLKKSEHIIKRINNL